MTEHFLEDVGEEDLPPSSPGGRRRAAKRRRGRGLLILVLVLALVGGGAYLATGLVRDGLQSLQDRFGPAADYPGPGSGEVSFEVNKGDSVAQIGRNLKAAGVIASVDAFMAAASGNPQANTIQVGVYPMLKQMAAADALDILVNPDNISRTTVTIPEGLRVSDILDRLADATDFPRKEFKDALADTEALGLPDYAEGNPEGYLFPATYDIAPDDTPATILKAMVDRWREVADEVGLEDAAAKLGYTPAELMIVASLVEAEASRPKDRGKVARVIYNRLEGDETNGLLQVDASVNYGLKRKLGVALTTEQLKKDTPYNTYTRPGLPPTPIEAPGQAAMEAAANPTKGGWYYYVTVNLRTGETKFAETYDEFLTYKRQLQEYCTTSKAC